jgi:membrane protein DedA with SNARE-associated domain
MEETLVIVEAINTLGHISYWGIFGLSLLANLFIPVPEEVFLLALGYLSGGDTPTLNPWLTGAIVIPGLLISDIFLFTLARKGSRYVRILEKKISNFKFTRDHDFVERHIVKIIFVSRFVIQFRFIGPVLAGTTRTSYRRFILWDMIALCVYVPLVILIGNYFHARIARVLEGVALAKNYILLGLGLLVVIWGFWKIRQRFLRRFIFHFSDKEGYVNTFIPGIHKKVHSDLFDHRDEDLA